MHQDVVDPADEVPAIAVFVPDWLLRPKPVEEADFAEDYRFGCLEEFFADPMEYAVGFDEPKGTGGY